MSRKIVTGLWRTRQKPTEAKFVDIRNRTPKKFSLAKEYSRIFDVVRMGLQLTMNTFDAAHVGAAPEFMPLVEARALTRASFDIVRSRERCSVVCHASNAECSRAHRSAIRSEDLCSIP